MANYLCDYHKKTRIFSKRLRTLRGAINRGEAADLPLHDEWAPELERRVAATEAGSANVVSWEDAGAARCGVILIRSSSFERVRSSSESSAAQVRVRRKAPHCRQERTTHLSSEREHLDRLGPLPYNGGREEPGLGNRT